MIYAGAGIIAALLLVIENYDILTNRSGAFHSTSWKVYRRFLNAVVLFYITDILWGFFEDMKLPHLLFADTTLYFITLAIGVLFWAEFTVAYLEDHSAFGRALIIAGRVIAGLIAILNAVNIFVPVLFTVDSESVYSALTLRYVMLVVQILFLLLISAFAAVSYLRLPVDKRYRYRTLALFGAIMAAFLILQIWYPYLPLYTVAYMFGTCMLHAFVVSDEREEYRRGIEEGAKVRELKQYISDLLDNMPAMSFTKDAETGVYLACNQAFAEYAHKNSPGEVVGLTDEQIFDWKAADHFVEEDKKTLAMDRPNVYFEDVTDSEGKHTRFQTTKLKFHDDNGRLCVLGMSVDVTEIERVTKERERTEAAYKQLKNDNAIYESIVSALSEDYFDLYYVDLDTDEYVEYGSRTGLGHRSTEHRGSDFFKQSRTNAHSFIYEADRERFIEQMDKEYILSHIKKHGTFILQYRLLIAGVPTYVNLKATVIPGDDRHMIFGVSNIDAQMKDRLAARNIAEERKAYNRLSALNSNLVVLYFVDPKNDRYNEFSSSEGYSELGIAKQGNNFFVSAYENSLRVVHPEDQSLVQSQITKENILKAIEKNGVFTLDYRLMNGSLPTYVRFKAAKIVEDGKPMLIIGLLDEDSQIRREQELAKDLSRAKDNAKIDSLTGVKNKNAFIEEEKKFNEEIKAGTVQDFAIVICDMNDLKQINDNLGHKVGDRCIKKVCAEICTVFKRSPVYRIGGDEFAVICRGYDYEHISELMAMINAANKDSRALDESKVACGMAKYENDESFAKVFERADQRMYEMKCLMKGI